MNANDYAVLEPYRTVRIAFGSKLFPEECRIKFCPEIGGDGEDFGSALPEFGRDRVCREVLRRISFQIA